MKRATRFIVYIITYIRISIHALVKRATPIIISAIFIAEISIHALVKRATKLVGDLDYTIEHFNPRPREEGDNVHT